jgi:hypothetical protein
VGSAGGLYTTPAGRRAGMRRVYLITFFVISSAALGYTQQAPRARQDGQTGPPKVSASYGTSSEGSYLHIEVKNGKLRYTYNKQNSLDKPGERNMAQQPHYTQADLVTEEAALSPAELKSLAGLIRRSGFMRLKKVYDNRHGYRYYPDVLSAGLGNQVTQVEWRHGPRPKAFDELHNRLLTLVNQKLNKKLYIPPPARTTR